MKNTHVISQGFSNIASDKLATQPTSKPKLYLKVFVNIEFNMEFS